MGKAMVIDDARAVGARIRELRLALGYKSSTEFANYLGITVQGLSNWERGWRRITLDEAVKFRDKLGVGYNWLYHGDMLDMPQKVRDAIEAYRKRQRPNQSAAPLKMSA